jgi:predicted dehydrogenase
MVENHDPSYSIPNVGIGLLGYEFMGRAHSNAYKKIPYMMYPPAAIPLLIAICGLEANVAHEAAQRYGFKNSCTDYHEMLENPAVQILDNSGPNNIHAPASIAAAQAGKHVFCEKPLGRNAEEAQQMVDAVQKAGVKHMVGFNYRFVPAVRLAYELIRGGRLGRIYHFRARYLQDWLTPQYNTPWHWRVSKSETGTGALGDLGAHIIDLGRYLLGAEVESVCSMMRTFISERLIPSGGELRKVDVDDTFAAVVSFNNGTLGTLEASRFATGHKNDNTFEINGEKGSLRFSLERLNELEVMWADDEPKTTQGFRQVLVTEKEHPFIAYWWPAGHVIGWEHTFVHELAHFLNCVANDQEVAPNGATFEDGFRVAVVCDAIEASAQTKKQIDAKYS